MKPKSVAPQSAVMAVDRKLHNTWVYIKRHWQLYLLFLMPAVLLTLVFRYIPMGGVLIAFQKYNPFKGIWGSEWVGFKNFTRFLSSPDFMRYLINTLKLSVYGLLWGFPIPILLAFLLNRIKSNKIKQKVQLVLYMPNFISVIVLCGIVRVLLSVTGPVNGLFHTGINFMTLPEAFRPIYIISGIWQGAGWSSIMYTAALARTYYQGIPRELREAADVDGASEMRYFFNILLPVCMPVVAVLALWQFVAMWNSYFDAMIYLNSASKQPLQLVLRSILIQSQPESGMIADIQSTAERAKMAELLKYATIIISSLPLLVMYPFFQKYFDAGIMAGSVKG